MTGLKWFRINVIFEDSFELVCAEYGSKAFEVVVRLWQKIYASGYYIEWNDEVALLFAKRYSLSGNVVSDIVKCAVKRGLFDCNMLDKFGVLTSHGIQEWYFDSVDRRKSVEVVKDYLLVDITQKLQNVDIIYKNVSKNGKNVNIFPIQTDITDITDNTYIHSSARSRFKPPTVEEVEEYCTERGNSINAERFIDYYTSNGWKVGKNPMRDWRAAVRTWERKDNEERTRGRDSQGDKQLQILRELYAEAIEEDRLNEERNGS